MLLLGALLHVVKAVACPTVNGKAVSGPLLAGAQGPPALEDAGATLDAELVVLTRLEAPMELAEAATDCANDDALEKVDVGVELDAGALEGLADAGALEGLADAESLLVDALLADALLVDPPLVDTL